ncbi:MAG: PepSY-associated TM helix domain-containing protein [Proteobacteria bacterium]|nr:PepSY-associated TM helix domain-containing protein [Pseudomonadota bacterium]
MRAGFLVVIGLTGSIIVFNPELSRWLDPTPHVEVRGGRVLDGLRLRDEAQKRHPSAVFNFAGLHVAGDQAYALLAEPRINPETRKPYDLGFDVLYLDPYTGLELGQTQSGGNWPINCHNIVPLVNRLHYALALPNSWGLWLLGAVATIWTLDCLVSLYLTFPRRRPRPWAAEGKRRGSNWVARWWRPSWLVKWRGSAFRVNFDLHRAGGLWLWLMLAVFAWSGVGFNLSEQVYTPVMHAFFGMPDVYGAGVPILPTPHTDSTTSWDTIRASARHEVQRRVLGLDVRVLNEEGLYYQPDKGLFTYLVRTTRDVASEGGGTVLLIDDQGKPLGFSLPTGQNAGTTLNTWLFALHTAEVWGMPFRLFVALIGLLVSGLSITGIYIWWKKRRSRSPRRRTAIADPPQIQGSTS